MERAISITQKNDGSVEMTFNKKAFRKVFGKTGKFIIQPSKEEDKPLDVSIIGWEITKKTCTKRGKYGAIEVIDEDTNEKTYLGEV